MTLSRQLFAPFRLEVFSLAQIGLTPDNPSEVRFRNSFDKKQSNTSFIRPRIYSKGFKAQ